MTNKNQKFKKLIQNLPAKKECHSLEISEGSILVTAAGFEDRALVASEIIVSDKKGHALILKYKPYDKRNKLKVVIEALKKKCLKIDENKDVIEFNRYDPEIFAAVLQKRLVQKKVQRVILDISAMSKLAQLLCLNVCWGLNLDVSVFYAEAAKKGPEEKEFEVARENKNLHQPSIQIYTGVHDVIHVTGLSSVAMQGQPSAAIVFMSFNELLTQSLLNTVYPSRLFLINSRSPKWSWREKAIAWIHEQLRGEWQESDNPLNKQAENEIRLPQRSVSTVDYKETVQVLLELYWQLSADHRILLAPTGTKIQTLGCFLVKAMHPDIHIEYPTPKGFLDTYSKGIGKKWLVEFGPLKDKINFLRSEERKLLLEIDTKV